MSHKSPNHITSHSSYNLRRTIYSQYKNPEKPSLPTLYPIPLTQSAVNTQFHIPFPSHPLFTPLTQSAVNTQFPISSLPTLHPITLTQFAVNTQIPTSLPSRPLPNPHNTICCQHTIPQIPSLPTLYPINLTHPALNTQFPQSIQLSSFIQFT